MDLVVERRERRLIAVNDPQGPADNGDNGDAGGLKRGEGGIGGNESRGGLALLLDHFGLFPPLFGAGRSLSASAFS